MRSSLLVLAMFAVGCASSFAKPPAADAPTRIVLVWQYWGRTLQTWTIERSGEGHFSDEHGADASFAVSQANFDAVRDDLQPYEDRPFSCRRVMTDGAYGSLTWSRPEAADHEIRFDAGCISGDADDLFARMGRVEERLRQMRDAP